MFRTARGSLYFPSRSSTDRSTWLPFLLVGQRLADVVEEAAALGQLDVGPDLGRHHAGQPRHLLRVLEAVLAVGGAVPEPTDHPDELRVQAVHPDLEARPLALFLEVLLDLLLDLVDDLFDPRRVDPAVGDEALERDLGDLRRRDRSRR